jgi:predicted dienelactone hydrolase
MPPASVSQAHGEGTAVPTARRPSTRTARGWRGAFSLLVPLTLALALISPVISPSSAPHGTVLGLRLIAPSGPLPVGTTALHLVDHGRVDPWLPSAGARELMVTLWYPTRRAGGRPPAPWMDRLAAEHYLARISGRDASPAQLSAVPDTHSERDAPVAHRVGGWPVVLFSPGYGEDRALGTELTEDLASRGFVVAAVDHTYDATEVAFPQHRLVLRHQPVPTPEALAASTRIRAADARFVLDELIALNRGANPDAEHRILPPGTVGALDLARVGMFGHSLGGATTAETMVDDPRILAGIDLDGVLHGAVLDSGLDRPFLLMSRQGHTHYTDPTWSRSWAHFTGWHAEIQLARSAHYSFTDNETLLPQMAGVLGLTAQRLRELVGTIPPGTAISGERACIAAFFERMLAGHDNGLLDGPSLQLPAVALIP